MDTENTLKRLAEIAIEARRKHEIVDKIERNSRQRTLNAWADENHRFAIGDIIRMGDIIIQIEAIFGSEYRKELYVTYQGRALTKSLKPRSDGWVTTIPDDGREVLKIK